MKITIYLVFGLYTAVTQIGFAQEDLYRHLVVIGEHELEVPANRAQIDFTVKGLDKSLSGAILDVREQTSRITKALYDTGLKESDLATSHIYSGENYKWHAFFSSKKDYVTKMTVTVTIDSLDLLEPVIVAISEGKPDRMSDISFLVKNREVHKRIVLGQAVSTARERAELMVRPIHSTLGKVIYIEEISKLSHQYLSSLRSALTSSRTKNLAQDFMFLPLESAALSIKSPMMVSIFEQKVKFKAAVLVVFEIVS